MSILDGFLLGLVQGLTEFVPISSSGHLIILRDFFDIDGVNALAFDAVLQLATVLAVFVYFFRDLIVIHKNKVMLYAVALGTIPAVVSGLFLEGYMETIFRSSALVAFMLICGSVLMYIADKRPLQNRELTVRSGFIVGLYQCLALIPGISRSGATISGGLLSGLSRESAAKFSFILSLPIIFGSGIKKLLDISGSDVSELGMPLWVGSAAAFLVGLLAIHFLINYLKYNKLTVFIWYRVLLAIIILILI